MLDGAHWLPTSALIDEALGSKGNHLVFSEPPWNDDIDVLFMRFCYRGEHHRELERRYFETYYPVDDHLPGLRALAHGEIAHVRETCRGQALATSVMYNEAMPLYGFQNGLNVRMDGPHGSQIVVGIADPVDAADWSSARIDLVRRLLPHRARTTRDERHHGDRIDGVRRGGKGTGPGLPVRGRRWRGWRSKRPSTPRARPLCRGEGQQLPHWLRCRRGDMQNIGHRATQALGDALEYARWAGDSHPARVAPEQSLRGGVGRAVGYLSQCSLRPRECRAPASPHKNPLKHAQFRGHTR